jgi:ketosteroid isomerase-like protein
MSSANVELVRSIYAAWEHGDYSSADWAHPDIEFVIADGPSPDSWRGVPGMARGWGDWLSTWEEYRSELGEARELDDGRVLGLSKGTARGSKTTGAVAGELRATQHGAVLFHIRNGLVTRLVVYLELGNAPPELGLTPDTGSAS